MTEHKCINCTIKSVAEHFLSEGKFHKLKAPSYLGIPTTLENKINNYSVTALTETSVCFINADFFKMLIHGNGQFTNEIIVEIFQNEIFNQQKNINQEQKQMSGRVAETILCLSERLFNSDNFESPLSRI